MVVFSSFKNTPFSLPHQIRDDRVLAVHSDTPRLAAFLFLIYRFSYCTQFSFFRQSFCGMWDRSIKFIERVT
jgi:hypothetical protein